MTTGHTTPTQVRSRIATGMGKARIFSEALPFIKRYRGTTVVIKYGGSAMTDPSLRESFADDIAMLHYVGIDPVIVHGGGPHISRALEQRGIESKWMNGLRVTDDETISVVQATLIGEVNPDIVRLMNTHGAVATGVNGLDANLFIAEQIDPSLGHVGRVKEVNTSLIEGLQSQGYVPIVAPLARGTSGDVMNVNADTAAAALATALGATKLVYLTDVEGLYEDLGREDSLISRITVDSLETMLESTSVTAGMLPKLQSCVDALRGGVEMAHILDGRVQHAVLLEVFTPEGIGTMVTQEDTT
ncbi:MAG TPA: acetylglutamate kinase [Actinobacteria bacterium]|nr:acetylglutamate kinase [bacterium BMS3Bbin02]HDL41980.1 acetylglutamate kinase [Actinomycetota bacterium]